MASPITIALSGMNAATTRVAAAASNIANARTSGAREGTEGPEPYTPVDVVATSIGTNTGEPQGVKVTTVARTPATVPAFEPDAPFADENGLVALPNVDFAKEITDSKFAALTYKANAAVVKVASEMEHELLDRFDERA